MASTQRAEIKAIATIMEAVDALDASAAERVLNYVMSVVEWRVEAEKPIDILDPKLHELVTKAGYDEFAREIAASKRNGK